MGLAQQIVSTIFEIVSRKCTCFVMRKSFIRKRPSKTQKPCENVKKISNVSNAWAARFKTLICSRAV